MRVIACEEGVVKWTAFSESKTIFCYECLVFVAWVERSEAHQRLVDPGGLAGSTHPTNYEQSLALVLFQSLMFK